MFCVANPLNAADYAKIESIQTRAMWFNKGESGYDAAAC